jgi:cytochrome c biogenesis protein CcmG, thiol:disulfide interchange protein DsbE
MTARSDSTHTMTQHQAQPKSGLSALANRSPRLALVFLLLAACAAPASARLGSSAPEFALQRVDGATVRLADYKGQPVFVNFWATWCVPCREEMPLMQQVYEQYHDDGLVILAVDMEEDAATVQRWIEQGGFTFTFLLDTDGEVLKRYNVTAAPTSYFVSPDGMIRDLKLGALSRDEMRAKVEKLLGTS